MTGLLDITTEVSAAHIQGLEVVSLDDNETSTETKNESTRNTKEKIFEFETDMNDIETKDDQILASDMKTFFNTIISFLGSGVLGLPFAFKHSGILYGLFTLISVAAVSTYAMLLVVEMKYMLVRQGKVVRTYGDIGYYAMGCFGRVLVNASLVISQTGFCVAYLIFISTNIHQVLDVSKRMVVALCLPPLAAISIVKHMKHLAYVSLIADVLNLGGLCIVYLTDFYHMPMNHDSLETIGYASYLPFFFGVATYCFEGVGMVLPLENSMQNKHNFTPILVSTVVILTSILATFGICGYLAYGAATHDVITLNMEGNGQLTEAVKLLLCGGLFFTYPVMLFPVFEVLQPMIIPTWNSVRPFTNFSTISFRTSVVLLTGLVAAGVPHFGLFISFIGSTCCSLLAYILPGLFYIMISREQTNRNANCFTCCAKYIILLIIILVGMLAMIFGVYEAVMHIMQT